MKYPVVLSVCCIQSACIIIVPILSICVFNLFHSGIITNCTSIIINSCHAGGWQYYFLEWISVGFTCAWWCLKNDIHIWYSKVCEHAHYPKCVNLYNKLSITTLKEMWGQPRALWCFGWRYFIEPRWHIASIQWGSVIHL